MMSNDWLDKIVKCPNCKQEVRDGDRIWLDGDCLCPECYQHKRRKMDDLKRQGYQEALKGNKEYLEED